MRVSGRRRPAIGPMMGAAVVLWGLWAAGGGHAETVSPIIAKPEPKCLGPRHPPDKSIPAPVVMSTYPANGAVVRPGILVLRITFNVAMSCDGIFLTSPPLQKPCGEARMQDVRLSYDRLTLRMKCVVAPNRRYGFRLNNDPEHDQFRPSILRKVNFASLAGSPLQPFELTFSTSSGRDLISVEAAEREDRDAPANAPELATFGF
jgi:hypothetical protein